MKSKKIVIIIILALIIISIIGINYVKKESEEVQIENDYEISKCQYKSFKPTFKMYDSYDYTQDMEWKDFIYHKKFDNYEEYMKVKSRWNDILDMNEEDFKNNFMVITAIENNSMLGLNVDNIETDENTLYISLIRDEEAIEGHTCISYIIPRSMEREKIVCVRNLQDEEKDFDEEMKIGKQNEQIDNFYHPFQYRNADFRDKVQKLSSPNSAFHIKEPEWKDFMTYNFIITNDMPDVNLENWTSLENDCYSLELTQFSEYKKLVNNYNVMDFSWQNFKEIYAIAIIKETSDYTISVDGIESDENGDSFLMIHENIIHNVDENVKYTGMLVFLPNYRSLELKDIQI